jgi:uncharacterized protein YecT (DUF1311 family)
MQNADFTPDLTGLDKDYQILTELQQSAESRTFLARHLQLNRDVTITVMCAVTADDKRVLARYEADVERLKTLRHPNVIPVIEGRRLGEDQFAVVRARVRGSSLDQLVSAVGPIPQQRVAGILEQVNAALEWARTNGLADRHVAQDSMIFQQGSGRVLLSFDLAPGADGAPDDPCDDARTIGSLAWEMLSGQRLDAPELKSLAAMRPDLSRAIVQETNALVHCWRGGPPRDIGAYVAMLGAPEPLPVVGRPRETPVVWTPAVDASAPKPTPISATPIASPAVNAAPAGPTPVNPTPPSQEFMARSTRRPAMEFMPVAKSGWGFNARLLSAVALIAVLAAIGFLLLHRDRKVVDRTAVSSVSPGTEAAGEVALHARNDTAAAPRRVTPAVVPAPTPSIAQPAAPRAGFVLPPTRRHEPPRTEPSATFPSPAATNPPATTNPSPAEPAPESGNVCDSPASSDQRRCLAEAIDRNDVELNSVYRRLVVALATQAKLSPDDTTADPVERLRNAQRNWVDARDQQCHSVGSGPLYARERSKCFADQSAKRTRELTQQLNDVGVVRPDTGLRSPR